ncbi:hypothetical protein J7L06_06605 [Candidatus Bathyarchaeota archaeon]|nr:hypothetical protein [Candidatus Bathyarchaeota archaeon]
MNVRLKPLSFIYWSRAVLGFLTGVVTALLKIDDLPALISISLLIYLVTYYLYKLKFISKVKKPSSIVTTGIGAYFITWLVTLILLYTVLYTPF